jgi:predicted nucleic acid-binding protein
MILVDTSVLIDYFKNIQNVAAKKMQYILDMRIPFGINSFIFQELLQGAKTKSEFDKLKNYFETQIFYGLKDEKESFAKAAEIYFMCRKRGYQVGSTIDCIIAQTAIENNLLLLHHDSDFTKIAQVINLQFY